MKKYIFMNDRCDERNLADGSIALKYNSNNKVLSIIDNVNHEIIDNLTNESTSDFAKKSELPTKTSQLKNDSNFVKMSDIPELPDLSSYATKDELNEEISKINSCTWEVCGEVESLEKLNTKIPTQGHIWLVGDKEYLGDGEKWIELGVSIELSGYATKEELNDYAKINQIPEVPTKLSDLDQDISYLTEHQDLSNYALKSDLPKIPSSIATLEDIPTGIAELEEKSYNSLTDKPDLSNFIDSTILSNILQEYNQDYTAVEVFPTSADILSDTPSNIFGFTNENTQEELKYTNTVTSCMTATFVLRSVWPLSGSDVIIDWGDKSEKTSIAQLVSGKSFKEISSFVEYDPNAIAKDYNEANIKVEHTYNTQGKYIVKFYGKKYFGFASKINGTAIETIVSRVFDYDLPIAKHLNCLNNIAYASKRLLKVEIPSYFMSTGLYNINAMFNHNINLISVIGFRHLQNSIRTATDMFNDCTSLKFTDFVFPGYIKDGTLSKMFYNCKSLAVDLNSMLPAVGFIGDTINVSNVFNRCSALTISDIDNVASKLWNNTKINWTNTSTAFANCSTDLRSQIPTTWGGTNNKPIAQSIEAKLTALENRIAALENSN